MQLGRSKRKDGYRLREKLTELGVRLKTERELKDLSLRDVEQVTGVSISTLSRIERGENIMPDMKTIERLAQWLNLPVSYFFTLEVVQQPTPLSLPDFVDAHLRNDENLTLESAIALGQIFRIAYNQMRINCKPTASQPASES